MVSRGQVYVVDAWQQRVPATFVRSKLTSATMREAPATMPLAKSPENTTRLPCQLCMATTWESWSVAQTNRDRNQPSAPKASSSSGDSAIVATRRIAVSARR
jgi:hypothetical protein